MLLDILNIQQAARLEIFEACLRLSYRLRDTELRSSNKPHMTGGTRDDADTSYLFTLEAELREERKPMRPPQSMAE